MSGPFEEVLLNFSEFAVPMTKPVDFDAVIGGELLFEARELLGVATTQRDTLMDGIAQLGAGDADPRNVVASVETYLPSIYKITYSMEKSASAKIKLRKPLEFHWTSALVKKPKQSKMYKGTVLVYELAFVLTIHALSLYNMAGMLLHPEKKDRMENLKSASTQLRKGSGILDFVGQVLLPRWMSPPENRPPEVMSEVISIVSELFLCMSQRIAIVQGMLKPSPPKVLGKLLLGLSQRYENVMANISRLGSLRDKLLEIIVEEPGLMSKVSFALALNYFALSSKEKGSPGEAVAFAAYANDVISGVLHSPAMESFLKPRVDAVKGGIRENYREIQDENEKVFFDGVPTRDRLEIPTGSFIAKPGDYNLPDVEAVSFAPNTPIEEEMEDDKKEKRASGGISSWFGMGNSSTKKKAAADEAAAVARDGKLEVPPGYDKEVFDNLPPDIQQEVVAAYKAENG